MASDTRTRILRAATDLFWERGYNATSVADILGKAGIFSGSLYHFFPGKEEVLIGVLDAYLKHIETEEIPAAWNGIEDPIERIFALMGIARKKLLASQCRISCPIGRLALELHEPDPRVKKLIIANFDLWTTTFEECLEAAADMLPPDLDRQSFAEELLSLMQGWGMQCRTHGDISYLDRGVALLRKRFAELIEDRQQVRAA